ncbi:ATPase, partial [Paenibacillus sepulcri]|nr:ATPase [Paenibacillus sepulcri]
GNSKTFTVITDAEGRLIARGLAGCGNHQVPGIDTALANIIKSADMALEQAGLRYEDIAFVQYGLAGADRQKDFDILRPCLASLPFLKWDVVCDTYEGLRAGTKDNIGIVLVCGSGTNAAGR